MKLFLNLTNPNNEMKTTFNNKKLTNHAREKKRIILSYFDTQSIHHRTGCGKILWEK